MNFDLSHLSTFDLIVIGSVFGLVLAFWLVVCFLWVIRRARRAQKVDVRLGVTDREMTEGTKVLRLWQDGKVATTAVPGRVRRLSLGERFRRAAHESELDSGFYSLLLGTFGACGLAFLVLFILTETILAGIAVVVAGLFSLRFYIGWRIGRRNARFERQFVDALDLAARSLRAGHPLLGAFHLIADEIPEPVGPVFDAICQRQALGMSLEDALRQTAREHPNKDLGLFVTSVVIQMRSGGNLADMMERIADVIRDRLRLVRKVRTLTAQTQFSKRILIALPIIMLFVLNLLNPKYMAVLYRTTDGQIILGLAGAGMVVGIWLMNKIAVLRY